MLSKIKHFTITAKEKAAVAFVCSAVGSYLVQTGMTLNDIRSFQAVKALIVGIITQQLVYRTRNTQL